MWGCQSFLMLDVDPYHQPQKCPLTMLGLRWFELSSRNQYLQKFLHQGHKTQIFQHLIVIPSINVLFQDVELCLSLKHLKKNKRQTVQQKKNLKHQPAGVCLLSGELKDIEDLPQGASQNCREWWKIMVFFFGRHHIYPIFYIESWCVDYKCGYTTFYIRFKWLDWLLLPISTYTTGVCVCAASKYQCIYIYDI